MTPAQVRSCLNKVGLSNTTEAALVIGTDPATVRRWKQLGTDGCNAILLKVMASGKITIQDVEQAHD